MTLRLAPRHTSRSRSSHPPARRGGIAPPRATEAERHRRAGGPQDSALYACGCGLMFEAVVTTAVGCPHCGTDQAW